MKSFLQAGVLPECVGLSGPALTELRYGLVVRISGSHPGGPGSIPGNGITFFWPAFFCQRMLCQKVCMMPDPISQLGKILSTWMGFEPTRAEPIGLAVQSLTTRKSLNYI